MIASSKIESGISSVKDTGPPPAIRWRFLYLVKERAFGRAKLGSAVRDRKDLSALNARVSSGHLHLVILTASLLFSSAVAHAQGGPLQQGGAITPGHIPFFPANGVVSDGGSAQNGKVKEIGITNTGTPFCVNDADPSGPYHQLCFGANSLGGGLVSFQAYNGAPVTSLMCNINGVQTPCELSASNVQNLPGPLTVAGNITTPGLIQGENLKSIGDSYIGGTIYVTGLVQAENLKSIGDSYVGGTIFVTGQVQTGGDADIGHNLAVDNELSVAGETFANGGLDVSGQVANGGGASLYVNGTGYFTQDVNVNVGLHVNGPNSIFRQGLVVNPASGALVALQVGQLGGPSGDLQVYGDAFANSWQINSDLKLKTDIKDFKIDAVGAIKKLHPISFHFVSGGKRRVGLIADELQQVVPQAVGDLKGTKTIDPMALIDVLIVANRELADRVEALEKKVGAAH